MLKIFLWKDIQLIRNSFKVLIVFILSTQGYAQNFTWFGTTCVVLQDGQTSIMFDPFITHPDPLDVIFFQNIDSDKELVKKWMTKADIKSIDAIFVNHAHYDHIMDFGTVLRDYQSIGYGSESAINFALGQNIKTEKLVTIHEGQKINVKDYEVNVFKTEHPDHLFGHIFMNGKIEKPITLPTSAWDLKKGEDFVFYLKNQKGNIMFHPFANKSPYISDYSPLKARVLFLGVAKRTSTLDQIKNIIKPINPDIIIPMHFDNFLVPLREDPPHFPTMNLDEWKSTISKEMPNLKIIIPEVGKQISLQGSNLEL